MNVDAAAHDDLPVAPNLGALADRWADGDRIAFVDLTDPGAPPAGATVGGATAGGAADRDGDGDGGAEDGDAQGEAGQRPSRAVSYRWLAGRAARLAGGLQAQGLAHQDRVAILSDNSVDYAAAYLAIPRAGLVTVPLNCRQPAARLTDMAADAGVGLVLHDRANADRLPEGVPTIEIGSPDWDDLVAADPLEPVAVSDDDVAIQLYTSGSTGRPKGVLLTHGGQRFSILQYVTGVLPMDPDERLMIAAPMYHKNAGMQMKMAFQLGGTVILLPRFDAEGYLRAVADHGATAVSGVPTMFALMAARPELVAELDLSSVRRASIGSAPMTEALHAQASALFPDAVVTNGYGTTEVVAVFGGHPDGLPRPATTVGHPLAAVETRLVDPATGLDAATDPGTDRRQGELWVRSRGLMAGYHGLPEVTAERVTDGWYHTGDVMEADGDGWHWFVGRVDDMFVCAGENVHPGDVEQLLEQCPAVHQASVVPVPDELKGALPVAFVVPDPAWLAHHPAPTEGRPSTHADADADAGAGADGDVPPVDAEALAAEVKAWALANGPAYAHPRAVWPVVELPLAGTNKIDRAQLRARAEDLWQPR